MSPSKSFEAKILYRFPRVSGDEPGTFFAEPLAKTFSPRERG